MKKLIFSCLPILLSLSQAFAQEAPASADSTARVETSSHTQAATPTAPAAEESFSSTPEITHEVAHISIFGNLAATSAELRQAVNNGMGGVGVGLGGSILINPFLTQKPSPVFVGVDFSYLTFGRDKQRETATLPPYKTTFNYYGISGISRLFLTKRQLGFTPFIDGMAGLKIINTRTKIDKNVAHIIFDEDQPEVIHTTNDLGMNYGVGIGFYTRKLPARGSEDSDLKCASFSLRLMYLWGDRSSYVKRGSLKVTEGEVSYEQGYTNTNMIMLQLGISVY